jgi:hypothetical protein
MMGIRVICFVVTVVLFVNHAGWLTVLPAAGAIALPYFAVVVANSRQQATSSGFRAYEPRLPERYRANGDGTQQPDEGQDGSQPGGGARPGSDA